MCGKKKKKHGTVSFFFGVGYSMAWNCRLNGVLLGGFHGHRATQTRWMVFVNGEIPSFEMDDENRGTPILGNLHFTNK